MKYTDIHSSGGPGADYNPFTTKNVPWKEFYVHGIIIIPITLTPIHIMKGTYLNRGI